MTSDDTPSLELKLARAAYAEAEKIKKAAEQDRAAAEYDRGQADHRLRTMEQLERSIAARERWLEQHDEVRVRALVTEAEAKLKQAADLMKAYDADRHGAAIALQQINAREKREQAA
jgi:hypothetical protein